VPVPPLGPAPAPASAEKGRVADGRFIDPRLAIEGDVPSGFDVDFEEPQTEVILRKPRPPAVVALSFVPEPATTETVDGFFQAAAASFATQLGGNNLRLRGAQKTTLLGGAAQERSWDIDGTPGAVRITLAPACNGRAFYAVVRAAAEESSKRALEGFVGSLRARPGSPSAACAELE
jgi:hypothetical protein